MVCASVLRCSYLVACLVLVGCSGTRTSDGKKAPVGLADAGKDSGSARPSGWSMLGFDLASTYHNPDETLLSKANVSALTPAWEVKPAGGITGAAAIDGDVAYVLGAASTYAFDVKTGTPLWENADAGGSSSPTLSGGTLYVNGSFGGASLFALDAANGREKWRATVDPHDAASGLSSPVVAGKYVIVDSSSGEEGRVKDGATFRGAVVAFDKDSGAELWRFKTVDEPYNGCAVWSTVTVDLETSRVFASTGNNYTGEAGPTSDSVFALELETGKQIWHKQASEGDVFTILNPKSPDSDFGTNPILYTAQVDGEPRKLVGLGQKSGVFWAFDRDTGAVVWQRTLGPGSAVGGVLNNGAYDGHRILVASSGATSEGPGSEPPNGDSTGDGIASLFALDPATGDVLWERQLPAAVWAPITVANGVGFVAVETRLQAFDVETGEKLYEYKTAGTIASAPAVVNGRVFFGSGMSLVIFGHTDGTFHVLSVPGAP